MAQERMFFWHGSLLSGYEGVSSLSLFWGLANRKDNFVVFRKQFADLLPEGFIVNIPVNLFYILRTGNRPGNHHVYSFVKFSPFLMLF
jgi:hypothetical protein